jgi:hypothetical protein
MRYITWLVISALLLSACGSQNATPIVEDLILQLDVEPNPPAVGETTLLVTVLDADGLPIEDATVAVHGNMDHEGMTPVDDETSESVDGVYRVPFEWTMGGRWILDVTVTLPDNRGIATAQFEAFVGAVSQDSIVNRSANHESGINIHYMPDNDPAFAGDASVTVMVTDADGHPVNDVTISIFATMPEHEMLPISEHVTNGTNGRYLIPFRWTMAGEWEVEITATFTDGQTLTETFSQTIVMDEP